MSYEKYTWQTGEVITAAKLNHMEDGIASAFEITVYKVAYDEETYDAYVEVTYAELLEKCKKGLVLFIDDAAEVSCATYIVSAINEQSAVTLYTLNASNLYHEWTYTNGKYVLQSGD